MRVMILGDFERHLPELERVCVEAHQLRLRVVLTDHFDQADFLWLVAPDGLVDVASCFLLGRRVACGTPRFSAACIADETLRDYVVRVDGLVQAIGRIGAIRRDDRRRAQAARQLLSLKPVFLPRLASSR